MAHKQQQKILNEFIATYGESKVEILKRCKLVRCYLEQQAYLQGQFEMINWILDMANQYNAIEMIKRKREEINYALERSALVHRIPKFPIVENNQMQRSTSQQGSEQYQYPQQQLSQHPITNKMYFNNLIKEGII
ncbi:hypothetical protein pb186bvf_011958 [Paramecium bursaria]